MSLNGQSVSMGRFLDFMTLCKIFERFTVICNGSFSFLRQWNTMNNPLKKVNSVCTQSSICIVCISCVYRMYIVCVYRVYVVCYLVYWLVAGTHSEAAHQLFCCFLQHLARLTFTLLLQLLLRLTGSKVRVLNPRLTFTFTIIIINTISPTAAADHRSCHVSMEVSYVVGEYPEIQSDGEHHRQSPETTKQQHVSEHLSASRQHCTWI